MSTRSQIRFTVKGEYEDNKTKKVKKYNDGSVLIYRHSDGYPDTEHGVVESLKRFFKWNGGRNDLEYMTANFILFEKLESIKGLNEMRKNMGDKYGRIQTLESILETNDDHNANWLLGYGICQPDNFHWDIEYFYDVEVYRKGTGMFDSKDTITIKVRTKPKGRIVEKHEIKL